MAVNPFPTGVVTLMFTDIEGSTALWEKLKTDFYPVLEQHNAILRQAIEAHRGYEVKTEGDAFMAAFPSAADGVACTVNAQRALAKAPWPESVGEVRVRMGLHTGEPIVATHPDGTRDYFGPMVNRSARVASSGHGGQIVISQETRESAGELPAGVELFDLGQHQLKGLDSQQQLYQLTHPDLPHQKFPPLKTLNAVRHNLPLPTTSFIGRAKEVSELVALLEKPETHVITIFGPGGTGKTRISQHIAAEVCESFDDGVWFIELESVRNSGDVPQAILAALSVRPQPTQPLDQQLLAFLKGKRLLLVLDNTEQIDDIAKAVTQLRAAGDGIKFIVTTRNILHVKGERVFILPPLPLPSPDDSFAMIVGTDAVALFAERAKDAATTFELTPDNAPVIAELVRKLDGLPLAIELAAARMRTMSVKQILDRLTRRFDLLSSKNTDLPPRQRTIRQAIDWSYDLLNPDQKKLFAFLSIFNGGFTSESAVAICGELTGIDEFDMEGLIEDLRDKSLLSSRDTLGVMRYTMGETIREYAAEKFNADFPKDVVDAARQAHAANYCAVGQKLDGVLHTSLDAAKSFDVELPNLRAAMDYSVASGSDERAACIALALCPFLGRRGYWQERLDRASLGLERAKAALGERHLTVASLLHQIAATNLERGELESAKASFHTVLEIRESLGDKRGMGLVLNNLGLIAKAQGDLTTAKSLGGQSLALMRELNDERGAALVLNNMANLALEGHAYDEARDLHEQSLKLRRKINDPQGVASSLNNLGIVARKRGDLVQATAWFTEALAQLESIGDKKGAASCLHNLAGLTKLRGDLPAAQGLAQRSLELCRKLGDRRGTARALSLLSNIASAASDADNARRLAEESVLITEEMGDIPSFAVGLCNLAEICAMSGDNARAGDLYDKVISLASRGIDPETVAAAMLGRARSAIALRDDARAIRLLRKARRSYWKMRHTAPFCETLAEIIKLHEHNASAGQVAWNLCLATQLFKFAHFPVEATLIAQAEALSTSDPENWRRNAGRSERILRTWKAGPTPKGSSALTAR